MREIIVDNFAGGGGASTGIELATGRSVDIAINHDENAVAMHTTNHPDTLHYCESVFDVNPQAATAGRPVGLAWFSPDCRHFSKAKGSKPVEKEIRGLAWIVIRWALAVRPRVMMLENVEEFKTWGPLLAAEMRPDPTRAGETFEAFCGMLSGGIPVGHPALAECCEFLGIAADGEQAQQLVAGLGYAVDHRELRACDYGAPTIRKRFFMVMRCDGVPVTWPAPTHGDPKSPAVQGGKLKAWRTAAECIDWSIPAPSIFDRKKPLAENTLKRIARGIQRFVIDSASPFIVKCNHTTTKGKYDCFRGQALSEPLQTITKTHGYALAVPHLTKFRTGATGQPLTEPVPTVTAGTSKRPGGNGHALGIVETALTPFFIGAGGPKYSAKPRSPEQPFNTVCNTNHSCVIAPVIARQFGASVGHGADEPSATITAGGGGKSQLVAACLAKHYGGNYQGAGLGLDEPVHSVTTVDHHSLLTAQLMVNNTGHPGGEANKPVHTITTGNHHGLVTSHLVKLRGTCRDGQRTNEPMPTITAGG
ncbi:MAG TPA: DNA cytosine methyltransferase, partial [Shigella sp.]|nr:DNA cytosine methyltransferase [Shigella sp.]